MNYYFDCECGRRIPVRATQADTEFRCACGKINRLPALSKLSKDREVPLDRTPSPGNPVTSPARALMIVAIITIIFMALAMGVDIVLLASGATGNMRDPSLGISKETQVFMRMIWAGVILFVNVIIFWGAMEMSKLQNYGFAKTAAVLAIIPCFSLCCVVGVPFGIFALSVLNSPEVRDSFS